MEYQKSEVKTLILAGTILLGCFLPWFETIISFNIFQIAPFFKLQYGFGRNIIYLIPIISFVVLGLLLLKNVKYIPLLTFLLPFFIFLIPIFSMSSFTDFFRTLSEMGIGFYVSLISSVVLLIKFNNWDLVLRKINILLVDYNNLGMIMKKIKDIKEVPKSVYYFLTSIILLCSIYILFFNSSLLDQSIELIEESKIKESALKLEEFKHNKRGEEVSFEDTKKIDFLEYAIENLIVYESFRTKFLNDKILELEDLEPYSYQFSELPDIEIDIEQGRILHVDIINTIDYYNLFIDSVRILYAEKQISPKLEDSIDPMTLEYFVDDKIVEIGSLKQYVDNLKTNLKSNNELNFKRIENVSNEIKSIENWISRKKIDRQKLIKDKQDLGELPIFEYLNPEKESILYFLSFHQGDKTEWFNKWGGIFNYLNEIKGENYLLYRLQYIYEYVDRYELKLDDSEDIIYIFNKNGELIERKLVASE
jgi:hypothetical protein